MAESPRWLSETKFVQAWKERFGRVITGAKKAFDLEDDDQPIIPRQLAEKHSTQKHAVKTKLVKDEFGLRHLSRRDFLKLGGVASLVTLVGFGLPDWLIPSVEAQENGLVYYIPLDEFLVPAEDAFTIDFPSLAAAFPDLVKLTPNGYEFVTEPESQVIIELPPGKTIKLGASNIGTPTVPIENVPLAGYASLDPFAHDVVTTVGFVMRSDNVSFVCADSANPAVLDASVLDRAIYAESLTGEGTFKAENVKVTNYNGFVHDDARGLYRGAPAGISTTNLDATITNVYICPNISYTEADRDSFKADINKVAIGLLSVFDERTGTITVADCDIQTHWDGISATGSEVNLTVDNTNISQTEQGWHYAQRGAAIGVSRTQRSHDIVVNNSNLKARKGVASFWEHTTEPATDPVITINNSTLEFERWFNVGAFNFNNCTLIERDYRNLQLGNGYLLNEQRNEPMMKWDSLSSINDITIEIDSLKQPGKVIPVVQLAGQMRMDAFQPVFDPIAVANSIQGLKFQTGESLKEVSSQEIERIGILLKERLANDSVLSTVSWKMSLLWDLDREKFGMAAYGQDSTNTWEARIWETDTEVEVEQIDPVLRENFERYRTNQLATPGMLDVQWVRDADHNYVMKHLVNPTTQQQEIWLHEVYINPDSTITELWNGFTRNGPCYFAKVGEQLHFSAWQIDGDGNGYFRFQIEFHGHTTESDYAWGRRLAERELAAQPLIEAFDNQLSAEAEQMYPGKVFFSSLNVADSPELLHLPPQDREPCFVMGYYDDQNRPVLKMYNFNTGPNNLTNGNQGVFFTGRPGEEIASIGFNRFNLTQVVFSVRSGTIVSEPQVFWWGIAAPTAVVGTVEVLPEVRDVQVVVAEVNSSETASTNSTEVAATQAAATQVAAAQAAATNQAAIVTEEPTDVVTPSPETVVVTDAPAVMTSEPIIAEANQVVVAQRLSEYISQNYALPPEYIGPVMHETTYQYSRQYFLEMENGTLFMRRASFNRDTSQITIEYGRLIRPEVNETVIIEQWEVLSDPNVTPLLKFQTNLNDAYPVYYEFRWGMDNRVIPFVEAHYAESKGNILKRRMETEIRVASERGGNSILAESEVFTVTGGFHLYYVEVVGTSTYQRRLEIVDGPTSASYNHQGTIIVTADLSDCEFIWNQYAEQPNPTLSFLYTNEFGQQYYSYTWGVNGTNEPSIMVTTSRPAIENMIRAQYSEVNFHSTIYPVGGGHNIYFVSRDTNRLKIHIAKIFNNRFFIDEMPEDSGIVLDSPDVAMMNFTDDIWWEDAPVPPPIMYFNLPNQGRFEYKWGREREHFPARSQ